MRQSILYVIIQTLRLSSMHKMCYNSSKIVEFVHTNKQRNLIPYLDGKLEHEYNFSCYSRNKKHASKPHTIVQTFLSMCDAMCYGNSVSGKQTVQ